jgi:hypothetical protein
VDLRFAAIGGDGRWDVDPSELDVVEMHRLPREPVRAREQRGAAQPDLRRVEAHLGLGKLGAMTVEVAAHGSPLMLTDIGGRVDVPVGRMAREV